MDIPSPSSLPELMARTEPASQTLPGRAGRAPKGSRAVRGLADISRSAPEVPVKPHPCIVAADWDLFRLFFAVAHTGSVNRAAQDLHMSQPTLSRRLKELERYVGAPLFFRASTGVKLTQEGEDLRRSATDMMVAFESFHRDLHSRVSQRSSVIRISATEAMTKHWFLSRLKKLRDINKVIRFEIVSTIHQQGLAASDLDFVIRVGDPGESDLIGKKVAQLSFGLFASEEYLAANPAPRSLADLKDHEIIGTTADFPVVQSERAGQMPLMTHYLAASEARSALRMMPLANHFAAASEGFGLAFLAVPFALEENLVRVLPEESASMNVWLLRRRESELRKLTRDVRRFLEREFHDSRKWLLGDELRNRKLARRKG
jgi:DNA-binding transcriptional LysR family regulator